MKKLLALLGLTILVGCASQNPLYNPSQPISASNQPYIPNTNVATGVAVASGVNAATAPVNPYSPFIELGLGLATAITTLIAVQKNKQAQAAADKTTQAQATTNQLATSIVAQGPSFAQAVIDHASSNDATAPSVFAAINAKLPPDQLTPPKTS